MNPGLTQRFPTRRALSGKAASGPSKLEGAFLPQIRALVGAGIPVMGHIGLTPQRSAQLGGFKVQGKRAGSSTAVA